MGKNVKVKTTIEVLGKQLTRAEAEDLYYELKKELKMATDTITVPIPAPYPVNPYPYRRDLYPWYGIGDGATNAPIITCDATPENTFKDAISTAMVDKAFSWPDGDAINGH